MPHSHHSEGRRGEERGILAPWKSRGELKSINRQEQLTMTRSYLAGRSDFMILMYTARFLSINTIALENYHLEMRRRLVYICQKAHSIFDADHYIGPTRRSLIACIYLFISGWTHELAGMSSKLVRSFWGFVFHFFFLVRVPVETLSGRVDLSPYANEKKYEFI